MVTISKKTVAVMLMDLDRVIENVGIVERAGLMKVRAIWADDVRTRAGWVKQALLRASLVDVDVEPAQSEKGTE